jgi:hypothetical protein
LCIAHLFSVLYESAQPQVPMRLIVSLIERPLHAAVSVTGRVSSFERCVTTSSYKEARMFAGPAGT